jgi:hypothetical protein
VAENFLVMRKLYLLEKSVLNIDPGPISIVSLIVDYLFITLSFWLYFLTGLAFSGMGC